MAEPITIPDLENGKIDIDTLADIVNLQEETTVTRLSGPVKTWYGVMQDLAVSGGLAYETLAELEAITGTQGQVAEVTNDGDNTGRYSWQDGSWVKSLDTTSAKIEKVNQTIIDNEFPPGFFEFQDVVKDQYGNVRLGVHAPSGLVYATLESTGRNIGWPMLDARYAEVEHDSTPEKNIISATQWDGTKVYIGGGGGGGGGDLSVYTKTSASGRQHVKAFTDHEVSIGSAFENYGPVSKSDRVEYIEEGSSATRKRYKLYPFSETPPAVTALRYISGIGQSVTNGGGGSVALLTTPPLPNSVFMFNGGVIPHRLATGSDTPENNLQSIESAYSDVNESPLLSAGCKRSESVSEQVLVASAAWNGAPVEDISKGTIPYDNTMHNISQAMAIASSNGVPLIVDAFLFYPGSANWNTPYNTFRQLVIDLYDDINEDVKAMTGQTDDIVFILDQTHNGVLPLVNLDLALEFPERFKMAAARYMQPFIDSVHMQALGNINHGAKGGRAASVTGWLPLYATSAVLSGTTVTITLNSPSGTPLVIDTTTVQNYEDGNYGIRWVDDLESASVTGVTVTGPSTITVTLNAVPSGANPMIGIGDVSEGGGGGGGGLEKRTCIRDSDTDTDIEGQPMYNWLSLQQINVT